MDDKYTEYLHSQRIIAESINEALSIENARLKAHIRTLEEKINNLEEAAVHILKSCTSVKGVDKAS